jgi:hypothetical protein
MIKEKCKGKNKGNKSVASPFGLRSSLRQSGSRLWRVLVRDPRLKIPQFDFAQADDKQESKGKAGLMELWWAY